MNGVALSLNWPTFETQTRNNEKINPLSFWSSSIITAFLCTCIRVAYWC